VGIGDGPHNPQECKPIMSPLKTWAAAALTLTLTLAGTAHAALINRGGGMIYDTTQNLTWLADMNYALTSGYAAAHGVPPYPTVDTNAVYTTGGMGWSAAQRWAAGLVYGGYDDWRLPTLNPSDTSCQNSRDLGDGSGLQHYGTGCTGGELSHLFVVDLGNQEQSVLYTFGDSAEQIANQALFKNLHAFSYWSGTAFAPDPGLAWYFHANSGSQLNHAVSAGFLAIALREGDVATVAEPHSLVLVLLASCAALGVRVRGERPGKPALAS